MFQHRTLAAVLVGAALVAAPCSHSAAQDSNGKATLVTDLEKGEKLTYELVQHQVVTIGDMGMSRETDITTLTLLEVKETDEEESLVGLTYEAMGLSVVSGGQSVAYDSRTPNDSPAAQQLKPLIDAVVGTKLDLLVDESGEVTDVMGLEALLSGPAGQILAQMLDEESLRRSFTQVFSVTSDRQSGSVGDEWTVTQRTQLDPNAAVVIQLTMKITEIENGDSVISMTGDAELELSDVAKQQGINGRVENVKIEGEIRRDADDGTLRRYLLNTAFDLVTLSEPGEAEPGEAPLSQRISVNQESRTTLKES